MSQELPSALAVSEDRADGEARTGYGRAPSALDRFLYAPALVDWIIASYFVVVSIGIYRGTPSVARDAYLLLTVGLLAFYMTGVYAYRLRFESRASYAVTLVYHMLPVVAVLTLFFNLRAILPIVNQALYDENLYRLDVRMFGFEPTLALEPHLTPRVVEWFSFFYYSYFHYSASFVFVMIACVKNDVKLASFATGFMLVVAIGHFVYTLVPGYGPYAYLAHEYQAPLAGGKFYSLVLDTVGRAGPMRDIFPSLHTALPTYCSLFAWRYYPRVAGIASFFAANIMCATIVLRWHYAIDVVAGLALGIGAFLLAPRFVEMYQARREAVGMAHLRRW